MQLPDGQGEHRLDVAGFHLWRNESNGHSGSIARTERADQTSVGLERLRAVSV